VSALQINIDAPVVGNNGYRPNVGIILCNHKCQVLWARRSSGDGWQFPQGGVESNETLVQAVFRELYEEVGLSRQHVRLVGHTKNWLHYDLPEKYVRSKSSSTIKGQRQVWFLFQMLGEDKDVSFTKSNYPEFNSWQWVEYWKPLEQIILFKRQVYKKALQELEPLLKSLSNPHTSSVE